jgi:hypothetical protein
MFQALLPADGCRPPKHVAVISLYIYIYTLYVQIVGLSNKKCDEGNCKEAILWGVAMNTVQCYHRPFVHLHLHMFDHYGLPSTSLSGECAVAIRAVE